MTNKTDDDMAGIVSEPNVAPEVKPVKSLWPRPHEDVRIEPSLEENAAEVPEVVAMREDSLALPQDEAAPPAEDLVDTLADEIEDFAEDDFLEPVLDGTPSPDSASSEARDFEMEREDALEDVTEPDPDPAPAIVLDPTVETSQAQTVDGATEVQASGATDNVSEPEAALPLDEEPQKAQVEPVVASVDAPVVATATVGTAAAGAAAAAPHLSAQKETPLGGPENKRMKPDFTSASAERALAGDSPRSSGSFVAMAAGIVVALGLGAVAFMYGASALGLSFGGSDSASSVAVSDEQTPDELAEARKQIEELQARIAALEEENASLSAVEAEAAPSDTDTTRSEASSASEPGNSAEQSAGLPPDNAEPLPATPPQGATSPSSGLSPSASAESTAPTESASVDSTPAPPATATPPAVPQPRPSQSARVESSRPQVISPSAQPSYTPNPRYEQPRAPAASPEMPFLRGWYVRDVYNGLAVVQSGGGAPMEVGPGDRLPGGNRVLAIRRLGGGWAVITERGIIAAR